MGHDEPLLRLVWGPRVLLTKAQTDLVLRFRATVLQVGPQFYRQRREGLGQDEVSHSVPTCAHIPCPGRHCAPTP